MGIVCSTMRCSLVWLTTMGLLIASCSTRDARPVNLSDPTDTTLSCAQLAEQIVANKGTVLRLVGEQSHVGNKNAALTTVGVVGVWPALLAVDLSDAEKIEIAALRDRNKYLEGLRKSKGCTDETVRAPQ